MNQEFNRRIFSAGLLFADLGYLLWHMPQMAGLFRNRQISSSFAEKIMTVISAVNGCVYCSWFHTRQALKAGVSKEEIRDLVNNQFHINALEYELPALEYARHFAETDRKPDPEIRDELISFYGPKTAENIVLLTRIISFGNLYGNTWDAVISRFRGKPVRHSNIIFEMIFFLVNALIMIPLMIIVKRKKIQEPTPVSSSN